MRRCVHRIIRARPTRHFDMIAQDMADVARPSEGDDAINAIAKSVESGDGEIKTPGIERIAALENAGLFVEGHDMRVLVSRRWNDVQNSPSEIELDDLIGPAGDLEKFRDLLL